MTASELIKTVRKNLEISQDELARAIFVTSTTVSRWENGKATPSRIARQMLADYCEKNNVEKELIYAIKNDKW